VSDSAADELQRVFKTLSDPTRLRILSLLERETLVVQELMEVLGMAQSRVSRHLAILREAGLLDDRRDGTFVSYRFAPPEEGPWAEVWKLVRASLEADPTSERDRAMLERVLEARGDKTPSFFDTVGPEWDAIRQVFDDDVLRARAIARIVEPGLRVVDVGTGTGVLACELAQLGLDVLGIDSSESMLDAARSKLEALTLPATARIRFERADACALPVGDGELDAAFAHMVLHYMPAPEDVVAEMARVVKPGGRVVIVDFRAHGIEWMKRDLGVRWMGFSEEDVRGWFDHAGLPEPAVQENAARSRDRDLPGTFVASARRA
jgi:ArsR family transcriptional regulator